MATDMATEPPRSAEPRPAEATRAQVLVLLVRRVADCIHLQALIGQASRFLNGSSSSGFRRGLGEIEADLGDYAGLLAERAVHLGWAADEGERLSMRPALTEGQPAHSPRRDHASSLLEAIAAFARGVRGSLAETDRLGDAESAGILAEISRVADTWLWCFEVPRPVEVTEAPDRASRA